MISDRINGLKKPFRVFIRIQFLQRCSRCAVVYLLIPLVCAFGVCPGFGFGGRPLGLPIFGAAGGAMEILGREDSGSDIVVTDFARDGTTSLGLSVEGVEVAGSLSFGGTGGIGILADAALTTGLTGFSGILAEANEGAVSEMGVLGM